MKIGLIGELFGGNTGEPLLFDCTKYLIDRFEKNVEYVYIDMFSRERKTNEWVYKDSMFSFAFIIKVCRKLYKVVFRKKTSFVLDELYWNFCEEKKNIENYYRKKFYGLDGLIIMGAGTIKYDKRLNFAPYYKLIMSIALENKVKVFINCAGIESLYNPSDRRCRMFEEALNNDMMSIITTRDDIDTLKKYIHNDKIEVAKIADIGTWSSETYGIEKELNTNIVGLGMITPNRFKEFGRNIDADHYENVWIDIIKNLDNKGIKWKIFNNGDYCDRDFAIHLCEKLGKNPNTTVLSPENPQELVKIISKFKGIITSRLHSCIVSYSLDIPFIALSWNNKIQYFSKNIKVFDRVIDEKNFSADIIVEKFEKALKEGYDLKFKEIYKMSNIIYIKKYLDEMKKGND